MATSLQHIQKAVGAMAAMSKKRLFRDNEENDLRGMMGWMFLVTVTTLWWTNSLLLKMTIEIVDFPNKHGDFPLLC